MSTTTIVIAVAILVVGAVLFFSNRAGQVAAPDIRVLSQLRQAGSDLSKPHQVEFFLYFPEEAGARRAEKKLTEPGLTSSVAPSASGKPEWLLSVKKTMVPSVEELVRLREFFDATAAAEHGTYDGWGTPVVK